MKFRIIIFLVLFAKYAAYANTEVTNGSQVKTNINVGQNVDYILTRSTSLFSSSGCLNIPASSMEHSVIIFKAVKPSVVISNWLTYIKINGVSASNGTNCQVKMYNKGTIILPYSSSSFSPLTCYSGTNYSGISCSTYATGSNGGYMKTLTSDNLLNNIRSFKLKRGYMVTFATGTSGYGYSRCFIADTEDLEMNLPAVLAGKVSSYRLFKWYNFGKSGIANNTEAAVCDALNVQGCYTYDTGGNLTPDVEWIPHKIHRWWPGVEACGGTEYACTMKTDNEPANSADDTPASVDEVLAYWEDAMRTGLRLCSPSTYDGSNNAAWFQDFFKKIDERGWRCDLYDIHCYWTSFSSLNSYYNDYKRPLFISEWIWGASWNSNGAFANGVSESQIISNTSSILNTLNNTAYVERYFYWNNESKAKVYTGELTSLGETYAATDGGLGYKKDYEFVPKVVINTPSSVVIAASGNNIGLSWTDKNGDMIDEIRIQSRAQDATTWTTRTTFAPIDKTDSGNQSYTFNGTLDDAASFVWQIANIYDGNVYPSNEVSQPYYLYNEASGLFLSAGANWGTHAIGDETGVDFMMTKSNGKYTLDSYIYESEEKHYLGVDLYCDQPAVEWTITEAGTINGKQAYTLSDASGYVCAPTKAGEVITRSTDANSNLTKWLLLTRNDLIEHMAEATEDNPIDATFLLPGANFGRNDSRNSKWTKDNWTANGGNVENFVVEYWNKNFDIHQTLTDLPNGIYEITMQGYYRYGGNGPSMAVDARKNGTETLNSLLYANGETLILPSIFEGANQCGTMGAETDFGYVPTSISDASAYLSAGAYQNGPLRVIVDDGTLTIGVKKESLVNNDWTVLDNFRLRYLGPSYIVGDINYDKQVTIADVTALVNIILGKDNVEPYLYNHQAADVNKDQSITIADVTALVNIILGKIGS